MAEQQINQDEFNKEKKQENYGSSGNKGLYGEGQYTNQGKPDLRTEQAHQLNPDKKKREKPEHQGETAEQANRKLEGKLQQSEKKLSTN